ncbi:hypothetical protein MMC31_005045, partial [Peltigera leucophlebia]|nr:hypothetical protein [Peltigera leucophlebia]
MHTSLLLFLLANVVIGTPLSLNQRHNSEDISRREDTNTVPGIYSQAESSNINNNKELNFFANLPKIVDDNEALTLPAPLTPENIIPVAPPTPIEVPFTCSPQSASDAVPGGEQELQQACCKTTDE